MYSTSSNLDNWINYDENPVFTNINFSPAIPQNSFFISNIAGNSGSIGTLGDMTITIRTT